MSHDAKTNIKVIFALFMVHFSGDLYMSFIRPLLPVFAEKYNLNLTNIGFITGVSTLLAFIIQPTVGYLADRYRTRFFMLGGPLLSALFVPLAGWMPTYFLLLIFIALGSVGQSMFHPQAAGMVTAYAGRHAGFSMSIFGLGGMAAFAVGPMAATMVVSGYGLHNLAWTSLFGGAVFVLLWLIIPMPQEEGLRKYGFMGSLRESLGGVWRTILLLWFIAVLRAVVGQSVQTFIPIHYAALGYSLVSIGVIVSLFTVGGAVSGLICGHLVDKLGFKPVYYTSYALTVPCLLGFINATGWLVYPVAFVTGFVVLATMFPSVTLAQKVAPKGRSMVSSLVMGLAFGTGGMMVPITGYFADIYGVKNTLTVLVCIPALVLILIKYLPEPERS